MSFQSDCLELFGTKDLYQIFGLEKKKGLSDATIKKAYYRQSILWHPDRYSSEQHDEAARELAKRKFQVIGRVYAILGDREKRAVYDETGVLDEEDALEDKDWAAVWRGMFKKVTPEEIEAFLKKFRGSQEEMDDVKRYYLKYKGNMDKILDSVIGCDDAMGEDRVREIIRHFIERGECPAYARFINEPPAARARRARKAQKEAVEAERELEKRKRELGVEGEADLGALIRAKHGKREAQQEDFLAHLAEKYGGGSSSKGQQQQPAKKKTRKGGK